MIYISLIEISKEDEKEKKKKKKETCFMFILYHYFNINSHIKISYCNIIHATINIWEGLSYVFLT